MNSIRALLDATKGYQAYELPQKQIEKSTKRLEAIKSSYRNNKAFERAYIDQDGNLHRLGRSYEVRFDSDVYDLIHTLGPPVKKGNQHFVNFKLWRKGPQTYVGRDDQVIRRMPFSDLYELAQEDFFKFDIKPSEYILLKSRKKKPGRNSNEVWEVLEVGPNKVKVKSLNGESRWVKRQEIFFKNMAITKEERTLLKEFFSHGGKGNVVTLTTKNHMDYQKSGLYINMTKAPTGGYFEKETLDIIESYLNKGINFLLTTNDHGVHGAFAPKGNSFIQDLSKNLKKEADNYIIITPKTDDSIIVHEIKHYNDSTQGENEIIVEFLKKNFSDERFQGYTNKDLFPIFQIIKEQRAYATQAKYLRSKNIKTKVVKGIIEDKEIPYLEYLEGFIQQHREIYQARYRIPYQSLLERINTIDHALADEVDFFVRSRFVESEDFH